MPGRPSKADLKKFEKQAHLASLMIAPASAAETHFRHAGWSEQRKRVRDAIAACGAGVLTLNRFDECGADCVIQYSPSRDKTRLRASYCKSRFCQPCQRAKAQKIAGNLRDRLEHEPGRSCRFLTLTLRHTDAPLRDQIKRLYASFTRLRAMKCWKSSQIGGAFLLEVKHGETGWHPHLHIISQGSWLAKEELSQAWLKATGDSFVVDIRAITDERAAASYVTKYITKSVTPAIWTDPMLATEFITAVKGVRTCATFGSWRKLRLTHSDPGVDDWQDMISLNKLQKLMLARVPRAMELWKTIRQTLEPERNL